jgi:hypothetical protein
VADLRRYYGVRLADLRTGDLRLSELVAYIEHLPPGSAVWAHEHGLPFGWSLTDVFLTDLFAAFTGEAHPQRAAIQQKAEARSALDRLRRQKARLNL